MLVRDRNGVLAKEVKGALVNLSQLLLGACTVAQAAIPASEIDDSFTSFFLLTLERIH